VLLLSRRELETLTMTALSGLVVHPFLTGTNQKHNSTGLPDLTGTTTTAVVTAATAAAVVLAAAVARKADVVARMVEALVSTLTEPFPDHQYNPWGCRCRCRWTVAHLRLYLRWAHLWTEDSIPGSAEVMMMVFMIKDKVTTLAMEAVIPLRRWTALLLLCQHLPWTLKCLKQQHLLSTWLVKTNQAILSRGAEVVPDQRVNGVLIGVIKNYSVKRMHFFLLI
jgi:hypothetical protein